MVPVEGFGWASRLSHRNCCSLLQACTTNRGLLWILTPTSVFLQTLITKHYPTLSLNSITQISDDIYFWPYFSDTKRSFQVIKWLTSCYCLNFSLKVPPHRGLPWPPWSKEPKHMHPLQSIRKSLHTTCFLLLKVTWVFNIFVYPLFSIFVQLSNLFATMSIVPKTASIV